MLKQELVKSKKLIQVKFKAAFASIKAEYQILKIRLKKLKVKLRILFIG